MTESKQNTRETFDPEALIAIRSLLLENPGFSSFLSMIYVFEIVIDANMIVSDILARRRHGSNPSNNERLVKAGVLRLHVPSGAIIEMETRTLPKVARKKKIPLSELMSEWEAYKASLVIHSGYDAAKTSIAQLNDSDDAIYIELMNDVDALGVLTNDKHFDFLEFKVLNCNVLKQIQSYTMAISKSLNLQIGGAYGVSLTGVGVVYLAKSILNLWRRAPSYLQLIILVLAGFALIHQPTREKAVRLSQKAAKPIASGFEFYSTVVGEEMKKANDLKQDVTHKRAA